jgi:dTDP-4-dehydrorhamnose reductase
MNLGLIGANGSIGTELSFFLKNNVNLIPITRNQLGSIFLKHHGFSCRICDVSKENDAKRYLSDLDTIVILSYAIDPFSGRQTRSSQKINSDIIKNTIKFSKKNSTIIYFSTIRAFSNDIVPNTSNFLMKSGYEKEKINLEKLLLSESKKNSKRAIILRISQVFGTNQSRTNVFKNILSKQKISVLVDPEKKSNIVHTVTIKDAILKCINSVSISGIYSLTNNPQWTWKEVIDYYKKPEAIIEYDLKSNNKNKNESFIQHDNSYFWNLLKSNKKFIKPFLYYVSPKYEPQIQKKLSIKKISTAISDLKNKKSKLLDVKEYENIKSYLDNIDKNHIDKNMIFENLSNNLNDKDIFSIEEFNFNSIPGPFLNNLDNTRTLLKNSNLDIF